MSWKCLTHWKIPKDNFYPISMACVADDDQQTTTIVVASSEHVFFLPVVNINRTFNEQHLFTRCDNELDAPIRELKAADSTVFLVSSDGRLMANELVDNNLTKLGTYNRVLHVDCCSVTSKLFLVRQMETTGQIVLEVEEGSKRLSSRLTSKRYDLVMESIDINARFNIKCFVVSEANERFMSDFLCFTKLTMGDQILLVAINNSLCWLQTQDTGESDLITVRCFGSCVMDFEFSEANLCLTVLLQSGVLVVFNNSLDPEALTVSTSSVYLSAPIEAYMFEKENNAFLYSNDAGIQRVHYYYSEKTNQIVTERREIPIRGVIAITWIESKAVALLLTDNNQFYTIDCTNRKQITTVEVPKIFTIGKGRQTSSKRMTNRLTDEVYFDKRLDEALQAEQAKFDLLAVYSNRSVFEGLARVDITFHRDMPSRQGKTIWIRNQQQESVCLFASIKIEINLGFFTLLANQKQWNIHIEHNQSFVTYPLHDTFYSEGVLNGIFTLSKSALRTGPTFRCMLVTKLKHGNERLLLTILIPASVQPVDDFAAHFVQNVATPLISSEGSVTSAARDMIAQNNPYPVRSQNQAERIITYCIRNEQSKAKAVSFSNFLDNNICDTWSALDVSVTMSWHSGRAALCLKTNCPVAMDVVKRFLLDSDEYNAEIEQRRDKLKGMLLELQAVTDGELIVKLYRTVRNNDVVDDDVLSHEPR
ncbi:uncharacterized protein LOC126564223 [Anopheles maculipalpis]|uniref:uncharacterized protein LOC126564223 n=1 Tax=Anopheles maculipalpis TaxID=1496333 RepID=UPI00215948C6|nr:uncharacterized protein LOC126564223 [Anopheles maculipalpis]